VAREEQDREDLLGEATALVDRLELRLPGVADAVVVGFRAGGAASFFLGPEPVIQFNNGGQLRRAFIQGRLLKAEDGRWVELERRRLPDRVALVRHELSGEESDRLAAKFAARLRDLKTALLGRSYQIVGYVAVDAEDPAELIRRIIAFIESLPDRPAIARTPRVG